MVKTIYSHADLQISRVIKLGEKYNRHNADSNTANATSGAMTVDKEIAAFNAATFALDTPFAPVLP